MDNKTSTSQPIPNSTNSQNSQLPVSNQQPINSKPKSTLAAIFIIGALSALLLLFLVVIIVKKPTTLLKNGNTSSPKGLTNGLPTSVPTVDPVSSGTPDPKGFTIKIDKVIPNPPVKGGSLDTGMQYLEIDVSATYSGTQSEYIPGVFFYQDSSGSLMHSANVSYSTTTTNNLVTIPNKKSLYEIKFLPGQTVHGVYLIYQTKPGDHGKLLWINPQNPDKSKQRTTFTLF